MERASRIFVTLAAVAIVLMTCLLCTFPGQPSEALIQTEPDQVNQEEDILNECLYIPVENGEIKVLTGDAEYGYVWVSAISDTVIKIQITSGDMTQTITPPCDGILRRTPLVGDDEQHDVVVFSKIDKDPQNQKYTRLKRAKVVARLDEDSPVYILPNIYVCYDPESECVKKADEIASGLETDEEIVDAVCKFICENISYDQSKAEMLKHKPMATYLPDPDETLASGKGICCDYAVLTAAMLRSQGIPTKVVIGVYIPLDDVHAWNEVYLKDAGWLTIDNTFAASVAKWSHKTQNSDYQAEAWY